MPSPTAPYFSTSQIKPVESRQTAISESVLVSVKRKKLFYQCKLRRRCNRAKSARSSVENIVYKALLFVIV